jgi:hypothetical protein
MSTPVVISRIQNRRGTQIQFNALYPVGYNGIGGFGSIFAAKTTIAASGTGTSATITFTGGSFVVGSTITVVGVTPSGYNGTYIVDSAVGNTVTYACSATGAQTVSGQAYPTYNSILFPGVLQPGEVALLTDTRRFFVGNLNGEYIELVSTKSVAALTINTQPGSYTLQLSDSFNTLIRIDSAVSALVTIPNDATSDMPIGSAPLISWNGVGAVSIDAEAGVTVDTPLSYNINARYGKIVAVKVGPNHWELEGNLEPLFI